MTVDEVKRFLRLEDTTDYDADIAFFLPYVQEDIIEYLWNGFQDEVVYRQTSLFAFTTSTGDGDKITDDDAYFSKVGFTAGMDILVEGHTSNRGVFNIASMTSETMTLESSGAVIAQSSTDYHSIGLTTISRIDWPKGIKPYVAKMVWYLIDNAQPDDRKSESREGEQITYAGSNAYPKRILDGLAKWRMIRMS
jgi:hypothetical protein